MASREIIMPRVRAILDWGDEQGSLSIDNFFLKKDDYSVLYYDAEELHRETQELIANSQKPEKIYPPVLEQLSPKGLSLLSYIYSEKDNAESQPVVASTVQSFIDIAKLVESAPAGIAITVIFQPIDIVEADEYLAEYFSQNHKTVCKFEKTENGLRVFQLDSTNNERNSYACKELIKDALPNKDFKFFIQKNMDNPKGGTFSRQANAYQCGVFATKDARRMSKDINFSKNIIASSTMYEIPPSYFKGIQSNTFFSKVLPKYGNNVVNKAGKTLQDVYDKHEIGYIQYTNEKHNQKILAFLEKHKDDPEYIKKAVEKYSTERMTLERLNTFYSAPEGENPALILA